MKGLIRVREEVHNAVLNFRTLENIVSRPLFARLWMDSTQEQKDLVSIELRKGNRDAVNTWIKTHNAYPLEKHNLTQLRNVARKLGVKYYTSLQHPELVAAIMKKEEENVNVKS